MAGIIVNDRVTLIHCGLKLLVKINDEYRQLEVPAPGVAVTKENGDEKQSKTGGVGQGQETMSCVAVAVSQSQDMLAVCDDRKQVCVFNLSDLR